MKPVTLALSFLLGCVSAVSAGGPSAGWHTDVGSARAEARASDQYILVDLYADWCGWCRKLEREVFSDPAFIAFAKPFVKLRVDVEDGGEGEALQARYRVGGLPTLLVLSPRMVLAGTVEGYAPRDAYIRRISDVVDRYHRDLEAYDEILEHGDPAGVLRSVAERLHEQGDGARAARGFRRLLEDPQADPEDRARDLYLLADALRMDLDFEGSAKTLSEGKRRALRAGDLALVEAYDLLRIRLAQDQGGCADIVAALEQFLSEHPGSQHQRTARRSLEKLSRSSDPTCT